MTELHPMRPVPWVGAIISGRGAKTPFSCRASTSFQALLSPSPAATTMVPLNTVVAVPPLGRVKSGRDDHLLVEKSYTSTAGSYAVKKSTAVELRPPTTYNLPLSTAAWKWSLAIYMNKLGSANTKITYFRKKRFVC